MTKKRTLLVCIVIIVLAALSAMTASSCIGATNEVAVAETQFTATDELVIGHITDTHYFPMNYCYSGDIGGTEYENALITSTKLLLESSIINIQGLEQIKDQKLDYLVLSGDVTMNGEIQAHIEMSNLLRRLQNEIRAAGNADFQIFVAPGNHDMYNTGSMYYRDGGVAKSCSYLTTRYDVTKIYSSLGYPDLSDSEIQAYYDTLPSDVYYDNLPYDGKFVNSETASGVNIEYQYVDNLKEGNGDYENGDITYIAYCPDNYVFIAIDEEISDEVVNHHVGGLMYQTSKDYLTAKKTAGKFDDQTLFGVMHHNAVPHFDGEDSLLKDFTIYGWKETADFLADLGIRFIFTGHMHSNDIATHTSFNGNVITDIETSALIGYEGAVRYCKLQRGTYGSDYAENFSTFFDLVGDVDFTRIISEGFISQYYIDINNLSQFIKVDGTTYTCTNPGHYASTKLFWNIVSNYENQYLTTDFIGNLGSVVGKLLSGGSAEGILASVLGFAEPLVNNIVVHIEDVVLEGYVYGGTTAEYKTDVRGAKLCGYLEELVNSLLNIEVNSQGDTLLNFGMNSYLKHLGGLDTSYEDMSASDKEAMENLTNGTVVKKMFDALLDKDTGLYRIVIGLTKPIDLAKGMSDSKVKGLNTLLGAFSSDPKKFDSHAVVLDDLLPKVLELLDSMNISLPFTLDGTIEEFLNHVLDAYITDSFYTSLGEIAHNILFAFSVDETANLEYSTDGYVLYKYDTSLPTTYLSTAAPEAPSIENGKLPSLLTVTFGEDTKTQKNFVWYTDRRVTGTDIQYLEGDFDAAEAITVKGEYLLCDTTTANIDLGVFATLMHVEVGYHCVGLKNLRPGATYSYRVGSAEDGFWSEVHTFTTAPANDQAFELLLISDIQGSAHTTYTQSAAIMNEIESIFTNGYDFVVNCGDVVDNSRNFVQWQYFLNTTQSIWGSTTQVVASGNHDVYSYEAVGDDDKPQYNLSLPDAYSGAYNYTLMHYKVNYPSQDATTGAYYSFDYSGVHFTVLNTNDINDDGTMRAAQVEWLKNDLAATDKKFKVVIMHKGLYSSGSHSTEYDVVAMRAQLTPIISDGGVHLVLQGHDHTYSETYYLDREGKVIETAATGKAKIGDEGTLYVTLGTLGDKFYDYVANDDVPVEFGTDLHNPTLTNPTFGKLVYDGENLYYYGYEYDLETGEIKALRGASSFEWWQYLIIAAVGAVVLGGIATIIAVSVVKGKKVICE